MQIGADAELFTRVRDLPPVAAVLDLATRTSTDTYLVGGTVRDLILNRPFIDLDLAVDGDPAALIALLGRAESSETRFGTATVTRAGLRYDIARTRTERYVHPGSLPEVEAAGIDADLRRRDFTVNAIAIGLSGSRAGELIAAPGAMEDLEARQLAVLHDESFLDDPTRLLRLARYAARLGFSVAPHTRALALQAVTHGVLDTVSGTRIGNELRLLATEPDAVSSFEATAALGLPWKLDPAVARNALAALPDDGRADLLILACVFGSQQHSHDLLPQLDQLGFVASDRDAIAEAVSRAPELARRLAGATSRSELARSVGALGIETVALASSQGSPSQSRTWLQDLRHLRLQITGDDLIDSGVPEGPAIGQALQAAKDALYDGTASDRDSQLEIALNAAR